jgi:hypothetical protein
MKSLLKITLIIQLSVLSLNTFSKGDDYSCPQCDKKTETPITDDSGNGVAMLLKYMQSSSRKPASVDCQPIMDEKGIEYRLGPSQLYSEECRGYQRMHSLNSRGLVAGPDETLYWQLKDYVQDLRDEIRTEAIKVGIDLLDGNPDHIDVTKHPKIAGLLRLYESKKKMLKEEAKRLSKVFMYQAPKHEAYVEQGMIIRVKDEAFKINLSDIRTDAISSYLITYDPKIKKMHDTILNTNDSDILRETIETYIDTALKDKRDPNEHYDHYLNNMVVLLKIRELLFDNKGRNDAKTRISVRGINKSERKKDINNLKYKMMEKVIGRAARELRSTGNIGNVYAKKNIHSYGKGPSFKKYDGEKLYFQIMAKRHRSLTGRGYKFPEEIKDQKKKKSLEEIFDLSGLTSTERKILRESKSLSSHNELKVDSSKYYQWFTKYRQLYEQT